MTIMEELNELTVSPTGADDCLRTAHILTPSASSADGDAALVPDSSSSDSVSNCLKRKTISRNNCSVSPPPGLVQKHKDLSGKPFSSTANDRAEAVLSEGGSSKGKIISANEGSDSPPPSPDFARKHISEKEHVSGAGIKETEAEISKSSNNQLQECGPIIEVNPSSVKSSTDELVLDLEKRITNIEKLCHWIKAGKLDTLREIGKQLEKEN